MNLSMWILADWLTDYHPRSSMLEGKCVIRSARILIDYYESQDNTVYLCETKNFIPSAKSGIMCICRNDYIYLETTEIDVVFNRILQAFDYYNEWERQVDRLIDGNKTVQDIVDTSSGIFANPLIVGDSAYQIIGLDPLKSKFRKNQELHEYLAGHGSLSVSNMVNVNIEQMKHRRNHKPYLLVNDQLPGTDGIIRNLFSNEDDRIGMIILKEEIEFTRAQFQLVDILGQMLERHYEKVHDSSEVDALERIILDLLNGAELTEHIRTVLGGNGWVPENPKFFLLASPLQQNSDMKFLLSYLRKKLEKPCCIFMYGKTVAIIIQPEDKRSSFDLIRKILRETKSYCGCSYGFKEMNNLTQQYEAASTALHYGRKHSGSFNYCDDYVIEYLQDLVSNHSSWNFCHPALDIITKYDLNNNTDYLETLRIYLFNERNKAETSRELSIHRNTLIHRIEKIEEITDLSLDDEMVRKELLLSFLLLYDERKGCWKNKPDLQNEKLTVFKICKKERPII